MRYRSFLLFFVVLFTLNSCQDECNPNDLDDVIVGRWDVFNQNIYLGEVRFAPDGTLIDRDHVFFGGFVNGLSFEDKIYGYRFGSRYSYFIRTDFILASLP